MPATDSEPALMEDPPVLEDKEGGLSPLPLIASPPSTPLPPTPARPHFTTEAMIETRAVSMASNDCSSSVASPAEASPAKPSVTPITLDGTVATPPATSNIASASDSLEGTGTILANLPQSWPKFSSNTFGCPDPETEHPTVLSFNGIGVTLENSKVWKQFHSCGTEMIITKQGRRMFPYCRYRLAGLDPYRKYNLVLSITPSDCYRYRWSSPNWEITGPAYNQTHSLMRAFSHHCSPLLGSEWMRSLVSFYKLKLTNKYQDEDGYILLQSMHRYVPRLHVIPVPDHVEHPVGKLLVMGLESSTFTFPQTEFMAVTTYQNFRITQLKITYNPFAKGFREEGNNSRLKRVCTLCPPATAMDTEPSVKAVEIKEEAVDLSIKTLTASAVRGSTAHEPRIVLKPIMSSSGGRDEPYVPCIRGMHALGELVLVDKRPLLEPKKETPPVCDVQAAQQDLGETPKETDTAPTSPTSTPRSSPGCRKKRKRINRHWANSRGKCWKAAKASYPAIAPSPSSSVAALDDVDGMLFVSFTSKEALDIHVRDEPDTKTSPASAEQAQANQKVEVNPEEEEEEKIASLEAVLLQDFQVLKHRQVIHPTLQQVGLKLSSLDLTRPIDLRYLGVLLPLPPPELPQQGDATSPSNDGVPFISRTGKTTDITKIKGWKSKFVRRKDISPSNGDGSETSLSAFCSNMLDEYLESEGQYISERAAAFSTHPESPVAYQLPTKSSSYVKTLDSVLKHSAAFRVPVDDSRLCPRSHNPLSSSALTSSALPPANPASPVQGKAPSKQQTAFHWSEAPLMKNSRSNGSVPQRLTTPGASHTSEGISGQNQGTTQRSTGFTAVQLKLLEMETEARRKGLNRTQLTPERLKVALSVIPSQKTLPRRFLKAPQGPGCEAEQPECGEDFCRLGCVCSSLQHPNTDPLHCRRPECMFGCSCFKRRLTKLSTAGEEEPQIKPVFSLDSMDHAVQPRPGSRIPKLWKVDDDDDPEPLFAPERAPMCFAPAKIVRRSTKFYPLPVIREEDKDPVYKYLESKMTCARVREFNSPPPPEVTLESPPRDSYTANTQQQQEKMTTDGLPGMYSRTSLCLKPAKKASSQATTSSPREIKKKIEIQSACEWMKDRKKVLEALFRRLKQDRIPQRFFIGPYCINLVTKIFLKKPSGSVLTYRINISKTSKFNDKRESDDRGEEDLNAEEEEGQVPDPKSVGGVTPFLRGILPSGYMRAMTKPAGCQEARGLVQVNGKSYDNARLLLGSMGSLHPANRLAAYVTRRLSVFGAVHLKIRQKPVPANKISDPGTLQIKANGTVVPAAVTARKTAELRTPTRPPVQASQPDSTRNARTISPQQSQRPLAVNSAYQLISGQGKMAEPFQTSSTTSNVSLTVSPSLKSPSFLERSSTYSFRICPPASKGPTGQNLPGVILPGGFTLIQLPKNGDDGATQQSGDTQQWADVDKEPPQEDGLCKVDHLAANSHANCNSLDSSKREKEVLSSSLTETRSSPPGLTCNEKADENNQASMRNVDSSPGSTSDDFSDSSDASGDDAEEMNFVDVEIVKEEEQELAIAKMKDDMAASWKSRAGGSSEEVGSTKLGKGPSGTERHKIRRRQHIHTVLERERRIRQRHLFDKLQTVLQSDPKAPRLRLLTMALNEISNLVATSTFLEEQRKRLIHIQSIYLKKLSLLTGKSVSMMKVELKKVYDKQKMREKTRKWAPFYSKLLRSRAALLADADSQPHPSHLLQNGFCMDTIQPNAEQNRAEQTSTPQAMLSPAQVETAGLSPQAVDQWGGPEAPMESQPLVPSVKGQPEITTCQEGDSPEVVPSATLIQPQMTLTLPLIRSKNGRIILPSSVKPSGQGYYTLLVVKPKPNGDMQLPDADRLKDPVNSDHPIEWSDALDEVRPPVHSGGKAPLAGGVQLDKSMSGMDLKKAELLVLKNGSEASPTVEPKLGGSPATVRRRGRPRKHPIKPMSKNTRSAIIQNYRKSVCGSETSVLVEGNQGERIKRNRGRPPKKKQGEDANRSKYDKDVYFRCRSHNSGHGPKLTSTPVAGEVNESRPLTRASLGKDFPSEKKRSWIDVEKQLEPDLDAD